MLVMTSLLGEGFRVRVYANGRMRVSGTFTKTVRGIEGDYYPGIS